MSAQLEPPFVAGRPLVKSALVWAAQRHHGQSRAVDDAPFIVHPLEVAALLSSRGCDEEVIAAGVLHDVVEGTGAGIGEVRDRFGERVADIVAAVSEDESIEGWPERKAALRMQVAAAGGDAQVVYAADKLAKTRELRAQGDAALDGQLEHYEESLRMLEEVASDVPFVTQLAFELWAARALRQRVLT